MWKGVYDVGLRVNHEAGPSSLGLRVPYPGLRMDYRARKSFVKMEKVPGTREKSEIVGSWSV